jgi:hypothetical protein
MPFYQLKQLSDIMDAFISPDVSRKPLNIKGIGFSCVSFWGEFSTNPRQGLTRNIAMVA